MERTVLQQVADLLDTLPSGQWLQQQLTEYAPPSLQPHVLVLLSAPQHMRQVFPNGPPLDPSWQIWQQDGVLTLPVLEKTDLIIWLMPAMRLFPGEYNIALEQARQQSIPIWAIITGIERLSDENTFLHQRLPKYRASLPEDSQLFLVRPTMRVPLQETILHALDREATQLLQRGENRRLKILTIRLKERLHQERQELSQRLNKAERFASTAQAGVASLKILMNATPIAILSEYYALTKTVERLKNALLEKADAEGVRAPMDELVGIFSSAVITWQQETFEVALREKSSRAQAYLQEWYEEYTREIAAYFRFSHSLGTAPPPEHPPLPMEQFTLYLNILQKAILKSYDRFFQLFRDSIQYVAGKVGTEETAHERSKYTHFEQEELPKDAHENSFYHSDYQDDENSDSRGNVAFRKRLNRLVEHGRRLLNEWSDPTYDYEEQRREIFHELVDRYTEWFKEDLSLSIRQQQKPLTLLLEDIQKTPGDQQLEHMQTTLTTPQEQMTLISAAEHLLRRNA